MYAFDIETGPLPDEQLAGLLPEFDDSKFQPREFDPKSVKLGNVKDPTKRDAKIAEASKEHVRWLWDLDKNREEAKQQHFQDFKDKAALSAITGRVLAVGVYGSNQYEMFGCGDEGQLLALTFDYLEDTGCVAGFNSRFFDLPFLFRRAMLLGVPLPTGWVDSRGYWAGRFVDLLDVWRLGNRQEFVKLGTLAKAFGIGAKTEGASGADFARLWAEDRLLAEEYLRNDVRLTYELALAMGV